MSKANPPTRARLLALYVPPYTYFTCPMLMTPFPQLEAKYADPLSGIYFTSLCVLVSTTSQIYIDVVFQAFVEPSHTALLMLY